jgi:MerR family redox-sensitive transcriptional activator SoxR
VRFSQRLGISLQDIGAALETLPQGRTPTSADWSRLSERWRTDLDDRITRLQNLRDNLDGCIGCGCLSLERCRLRNPGDRVRKTGSGPRFLLGGTAKR